MRLCFEASIMYKIHIYGEFTAIFVLTNFVYEDIIYRTGRDEEK